MVELHYVISRGTLPLQGVQGNPNPSHGGKPASMGFVASTAMNWLFS